MSAADFRRACSASRTLSIGTLSSRPAVKRHEDDDLFGNGRGFELRLFEDRPDSLAMVDDLAGVFIEPCAELGERFQLGELRVRELEIARHRTVGRPLCLAAHA